MNSSSSPLPAPSPLPPPAALGRLRGILPGLFPGLDQLDLDATQLVTGDERPAGRQLYIAPARRSSARLVAQRLELHVAPGDEAFALALAAAFVAPAQAPAAAAPASLDLLRLATRVAASEVSVLIEGATGTGKEGLARLVHHQSPRRDGPFVAVNCAALPEAMLEATLFGHERGAFTGAAQAGRGLFRAAEGGTLLLDEVSELPLALQSKLLRALQEREVLPIGATRPETVNVRIIACANRDLAAEVAAGRFRADLFYRLAVFPLRTLPLAERREDIIAIAAHWLLKAGRPCWPSRAALARLEAHGWPGNVRELGNVLDRALVLADEDSIGLEQLVFDRLAAPAATLAPEPAPLPAIARQSEDRAIRSVLAETRSRRAAAERLGISERTLRYKLAAMAGRPLHAPAAHMVQ